MFFSESNIKKFLFISAIVVFLFSCYLFFKYFSTGVYSPAWAGWLISIILLLISFLPPRHIPLSRWKGIKVRGWFFVSFLLVIAVGVFFRLYRLDCFPWGLEGLTLDSAFTGEYAFKILDGAPYTPIAFSLCGSRDSLPYYCHALFFSIFGSTLTVLRCEMVFIGVINAVLVFFAIKAILRNGYEDASNIVLLALSGMGLYLFSAVDTVLNYSAFEVTITTPIVLGSFLALNWAFERQSYFAFCLAGLLFGLLLSSSNYFLPTAPAFIVVVSYYAISNFFTKREDGRCVKIGIFFLGTLFVVLPKILYLLYNYTAYFQRILLVTNVDTLSKEQGIIATFKSLVSKLSPTFELMFSDGPHYKFISGNISIVDKFVMPVFFLGIIYSFARIKGEKYLFLACYLCFTILHCILSLPIDYRFIPFMPFIYIFSSIGLYLISKLLKYRKLFYILAGIYLLVIVSFNIKNYYTGMGIPPLASFYNVKNTLIGRYLQNNFLDKRAYLTLGDCEWAAKFSTYNYRERDIDRPTECVFWRRHQRRCDDLSYKLILSNISRILADNLNSKKDLLFVFDDATCSEEIVSHLESVLNKKRSSFNIYSKSYKQNFTCLTVEIKKEELGSIDIARVVPPYKGKRYKALKNVVSGNMVQGLTGKYYGDAGLTKLEGTMVDKCINFSWGEGAPLPTIKPNYFSIEWNGYIRVDADDMYWFFIKSDDGARLWIDDDLIIDNWNSAPDELCEPVSLEKGLHKIKLQYFESAGFASISLAWASERLCKSIVPTDHLFSTPEEGITP